jgi:thioredoxin-like negative regulator of GroEL
VAAVNADEHGELASKFGVKGFPTIKVLYYDGKYKRGSAASS